MANGVDTFIWNRRQDLQGVELKILMIESHPWTKISLDILSVLQSGLNFSYTIEIKGVSDLETYKDYFMHPVRS